MKTVKKSIRNYCISGSLALACAFPLSAEAKTLYVNGGTGNDTVTYAANSESTPWRTIGRAAWGGTNRSAPNSGEASRAGDTILVAAGTYTTAGTDSRNDPAYNPVNSGTAGNPITFEAQGAVILALSSSRGTVIGALGRNYIHWRGFTINEANAPSHADTGSVTFFGSTGSSAENLILDGNGDPGYRDNHTGIRIEHSANITVRNNRIHNFYTSGVNQANGVAIQVYESKGLTIEHNELYNSGSGIFFKQIGITAAPSDTVDIVRYNLIHDVAHGIIHHRHTHSAPTVYFLVYQNIIRDASLGGITIWGFDTDGPSNGRFVNNTVHNCVNGVYLKGGAITNSSNNLFQNNLITESTNYAIFNEATGGDVSFELDRSMFARNWYWSFPTLLTSPSGTRTLTQFQSAFAGQEANGTSGINPGYVDAARNNFHLIAESQALTAGRVVHSIGGSTGATIPVGAYITGTEVLGLFGPGQIDLTPPVSPVNLRIQ